MDVLHQQWWSARRRGSCVFSAATSGSRCGNDGRGRPALRRADSRCQPRGDGGGRLEAAGSGGDGPRCGARRADPCSVATTTAPGGADCPIASITSSSSSLLSAAHHERLQWEPPRLGLPFALPFHPRADELPCPSVFSACRAASPSWRRRHRRQQSASEDGEKDVFMGLSTMVTDRCSPDNETFRTPPKMRSRQESLIKSEGYQPNRQRRSCVDITEPRDYSSSEEMVLLF
uniref:Uncharacterized protein n=1 Tax=Leersia perrieri TaxID=77586 RepID=A0A0D9VZ54_9ORYZ